MPEKQVRPIRRRSKAQVSGALATGWARASAGRKGAFADNIDVDPKTVNRALTGESLPELHTAFNSLADDPTALDELAALYNVMIVPRDSGSGNDFKLMADLGHAVGDFADRLADLKRCHNDTLALADLFRPLIAQMNGVIAEADAIKLGEVA